WHTTGSGKSLSMVFFASIAARKLNNPTMLVINDRNDLDDQLFDTFSAAHEFLRQTPEHVETRDDLRNAMDKNSGGIYFLRFINSIQSLKKVKKKCQCCLKEVTLLLLLT